MCLCQVDALLQDRQVTLEEHQARSDRDAEAMSSLSERLRKTQDLLYDSTRDYLALKYELRARERAWVSDKDELMCKMDEMKRIAEESSAASALLTPGRIRCDQGTYSNLYSLCVYKDC